VTESKDLGKCIMTRHFKIILLLFVLDLCIPTYLWSEENNSSHQAQLKAENSENISEVADDLPGSRTIDKQVIISKFKLCTIFLALLGIAGYFIKKRGLPSGMNKNEFINIQITEEKHLGQGLSLLLVKVQSQNLLLSKQNGRLEFMTKLDQDENSASAQIVSISRSPKNNTTSSDDITPAERQHVGL
jgi:flagellar biogenesis protein FliO